MKRDEDRSAEADGRAEPDLDRGKVAAGKPMPQPDQEPGAAPDNDSGLSVGAALVDAEGRRYAVGDVVARGGMGAILSAKDLNCRRTVAMKVMLDPQQTEDARVLRFIEEAQVTAQLEHPGVVPVHELGIGGDGNVFYTMKFVQGVTLQDVLARIAEGKPDTIAKHPLGQLLNTFLKACDAVAFAHSKGVVHRDLKPENIMVGDFGEVLVMDWGLAKVLSAECDRPDPSDPSDPPATIDSLRSHDESGTLKTMDGQVMGTPQFMAPEQALGKIDEIDARTDIYALGAILYNILTLRPPITGSNVHQVLLSVVKGKITPPSGLDVGEVVSQRRKSSARARDARDLQKRALAASRKARRGDAEELSAFPHCPGGRIPSALSAVAMAALAPGQDDRYQTVQDLQADVEAYRGGFATTAEHASLGRQVMLLVKRHKALVTGLGAVLLALAVGFALTLVQWRRAEANALAAQRATREAEANAQAARQATREAEASAERAVQEKLRAEQSERDAVAARGEAEARRAQAEYERYRAMIGTAAGHVRTGFAEEARALLDACPDEHRHWEWGCLSRQARLIEEATTVVDAERGLTVSPEGRFLGHWSWNGYYAGATDFGSGERTFREVGGGYCSVAFVPGGRRVLVAAPGKHLALRSLDPLEDVWRQPLTEVARGSAATVAVSANGECAAMLLRDKSSVLRFLHPGTGKTLGQVDLKHIVYERALACSPDGSLVACADRSVCLLLTVPDGREAARLVGHRGGIRDVEFSPDENRVMTASGDGDVRVWDVDSGECRLVLGGHWGGARALAVTADGKHIVTGGADGLARLWDADTGALEGTLPGGPITGVAVSATEEAAYIGYAAGHVHRVPIREWLEGRQRVRRVRVPHCGAKAFFTRDGQRIVVHAPPRILVLPGDGSGRPEPWLQNERGQTWWHIFMGDNRLAAVTREGALSIWGLDAGDVLGTRAASGTHFPGVFLSEDRLIVLPAKGDGGGTGLQVVETDTGAPVRFVDTGLQVIYTLAGSTDGSAVALRGRAKGGSMQVWDTQTWQKTAQFRVTDSQYWPVCLSPDARLLLIACGQKVRIVDLQSKQERVAGGLSANVSALCFSPDGKRFVSGGGTGEVIVWDAATGARILKLDAHTNDVRGLDFSPDGMRLVTASWDQTLVVWEADPWGQ